MKTCVDTREELINLRKNSYMSRDELIQFLKLDSFTLELRDIIENTKDSVWRKSLKMAATLIEKVVAQRKACLDPAQLVSVARRIHNTHLILYSTDERRHVEQPIKEVIQADLDDLETLAELALCYCQKCELHGQEKTECKYRKAYHRLGIEIAPGHGECEFRERVS